MLFLALFGHVHQYSNMAQTQVLASRNVLAHDVSLSSEYLGVNTPRTLVLKGLWNTLALAVTPWFDTSLPAAVPPSLLHTASPARATSASQHDDEEQRTQEGFTASVTLINNPDVKVDTFVLPPAPDHSFSSSLLREAEIRSNAVRALERSTASTEASPSLYSTRSEPDQFEAICLAFGADATAGRKPVCNGDDDDADVNPCISQLHRLNSLLREGGSRAADDVSSRCPRANRCPLVASVSSAKGGVFVSRRDEETDECSAVTGGIVGAILSGGCDTATSFQLVHAGKHAALRGSQFRIKNMDGGKITEVMPVLSSEGSSPSATAAAGQADDPSSWPRPRCDGAVSAAEWCKHAVTCSTRFEKMAMQSALGVGVLKRMGVDDQHLFDHGGSMSDNLSTGAPPAPVGVMPCLPAQSCFDIQEVELDGSLRVSQGTPAGELRVGDLCDFRAVGPLAAMQAEQDAYAWWHASRISAAIRPGWDEHTRQAGASCAPAVQGCLVASAGARFAGGFEQEGCRDVVSAASGHGGCPTVGIVSDVQLVSVDNTMVTCSSNAGLAGVYLCGTEPELE